ncbi:hypothetical protein [uncultured Christiangramia sp.]|uniref:hypothetical protein n=1 Tax=uncultured Christiangramia sp. TaxID=503836 RepID=UPI00261623C2|nr:hypothetical protein [uncultured Christiangramia sp.]
MNLKIEYIIKAVVGILIIGGAFWLQNKGAISDSIFYALVTFLYPSIVGFAEYFKTKKAKEE